MAQAGYTPIQLYLSTTASAVPSAGNLANGELAINITDGKLFYKDNGGVVQVLATKGAGTIGGSNTQVQYNSSGALAGSANLTFDGTTLTANALTVSNAVTLSAGTANGVAYLNGSKVLTTGSALTFDGTNLTVGGSAIEKITTNGNIVGTAGQTYVYSNGGSGSAVNAGFLLSGTDNTVRFYAANAEQARLTSGGLVVGSTTVPTVGSTAMLAVGNTNGGTQAIVQSGSIVYRTSASTSGVDFYNPNASPMQWYTSGTGVLTLSAVGRLTSTANNTDNLLTLTSSAGAFSSRIDMLSSAGGGSVINASQYLGFLTGGNERGRFDGSGRLLVGNSYVGPYETNTKTKIYSSGTSQIFNLLQLTNNGVPNVGDIVGIGFAAGEITDYGVKGSIGFVRTANYGLGDFVLYLNNNSGTSSVSTTDEKLRVTNAGNLLVGTSSSAVPTSYAFQWIQTVGAGAARFCHSTSAASGDQFAGFFYNGNGIGSITQNGTTGVLYNITSDYRLKTLIAPVSGSGERIDALNPVEYEWKAGGKRTRGFFAHEFQAVYADSVTGTKDAVDADGKPVYQAMQAGTAEVIADLVAEIQSLRKRLAAAGI